MPVYGGMISGRHAAAGSGGLLTLSRRV